jgi:Family of unknown function (DUF5906)
MPMMTVAALLDANHIKLPNTAPGRYYTTCPQCSRDRRPAHQRSKVLGVTINGDRAYWGCNHCGWTGPEKCNGFSSAAPEITYDYLDETGVLLFQKVRGANKRFWQRKPDGAGGWVNDLSGVRRVIYRLPEIIEAIAAGYAIVCVEGEKDADNLWRINVPATCNPDGAAKPGQKPKWRSEFSEMLRGADIVVIGDNDDPGRDHAEATASMSIGVAARVRMLDLAKHWPDIPQGGDISDWLKTHTREQFDELAADARDMTSKEGVSLDDFHAFMPMHNYIFAPSRETWPASSVNSRLPPIPVVDAEGKPALNSKGEQETMAAATWLDQNQPVEQMTWAPGRPMLIKDRLISGGGWIERSGITCFNLYRPPSIKPGDATKADLWIKHSNIVFGTDADHIIKWLAHRVQRPHEKINHALVFGGEQGIGKDALLEPVKRAIGPWNFDETSPQQVLGRFNGFLKNVILRISEARDLGDLDRFAFYDHMKTYTAAPPDVLRVDEKHLREYSIPNCVGVIITTNHKTDGIFLPPDDRRHFVAWSDLKRDDFPDGYWNALWNWYGNGGDQHVAAYLANLDISTFDPKAPPPKTAAFWDIVDASRAPEDAELADVLDSLSNPDAVTLQQIANYATGEFQIWIRERKNRRIIPHRMEKCDYVSVRNDAAKDGLWKIHKARQVIYAKKSLSIRDRFAAASKLVQQAWP